MMIRQYVPRTGNNFEQDETNPLSGDLYPQTPLSRTLDSSNIN